MNESNEVETKRRQLRMVQMGVFVSGVALIAIGLFLFSTGFGSDGEQLWLPVVLIFAGLADLVLSFFVFNRLIERAGAGPRGGDFPEQEDSGAPRQ